MSEVQRLAFTIFLSALPVAIAIGMVASVLDRQLRRIATALERNVTKTNQAERKLANYD